MSDGNSYLSDLHLMEQRALSKRRHWVNMRSEVEEEWDELGRLNTHLRNIREAIADEERISKSGPRKSILDVL